MNVARKSKSLERMKADSVDSAVGLIIGELNKQGITIHRYDAVNSNSIYLKFDYGAMGGLRISDHKGKGSYNSHKYNLLESGHGRVKRKCNGYSRYDYGLDAIGRLIDDIVRSRDYKVATMGRKRYENKVYKYRRFAINSSRRGFWRKAYRV